MDNMNYSFDITQSPEYRQELAAQRSYMAKVYGWMTIGLLVTACVALACAMVPPIVALVNNFIVAIVLFLLLFGIGTMLQAMLFRLPAPVVAALFIVYSTLMGVMLSSLLLQYKIATLGAAFFVTAGTFGAMSVVGFVTKRDLSSWGMYLTMALIGLIIASIVSIFFTSGLFATLINFAGVLIFTLMTAYYTQMIKRQYASAEFGSQNQMRLAISGALMLYMCFINLFLYILSLLGDRRR